MLLTVFGLVLPWVLLAIGAWIGYQLVRQNGRILLRLEAIEQRIGRPNIRPAQPARPEPGLSIGAAAPEFQLPDLAGAVRSLSEFRGRDVLLIFFNPGCGFCAKMAPQLAALPAGDGPRRPVTLVVSTGDREQNRALVEQHGITCPVLLQEKMEVASNYRAKGTPMGYLINGDGRIASDLTVGADALLELAAGADRAERLAAGGWHAQRSGQEGALAWESAACQQPAQPHRLENRRYGAQFSPAAIGQRRHVVG